MSCVTKWCRVLPVLAWIAASVLCLNAASASIVLSGDVWPTDSGEWNAGADGYVGNTANGELTVTTDGGASTLESYNGYVGYDPGVSGTVTVDGSSSTWTNSEEVFVGYLGTGILKIVNGGTVLDQCGSVGRIVGSGGLAIVEGSGSSWINTGQLDVGTEGNGTLRITDGGSVVSGYTGVFSSWIGVYDGSAGNVFVDGSGSTWTSNHKLYVGYAGVGTLNIVNGGRVNNLSGPTYVGFYASSFGSSIDFGSAGGTLATQSLFMSPSDLTGTGTIQTHGLVADLNLTFDSGPTKAVTLNGSGQYISLAVDLSDSNNAGDLGAGYWGNGSLTIMNDTTVYSKDGYIGVNASTSGTVNVVGPDASWRNAENLYVGGDKAVGEHVGGTGTLNITNGAAVSTRVGYIAHLASSAGTAVVTGDNSTWTNDTLYVGYMGAGTLKVANGGEVIVTDKTYIDFGPNDPGSGTIDFLSGGGTLTTKSFYMTPTQLTGTGTIQTRGLVADMDVTFDAQSSKLISFNEAGQNIAMTLNASDSSNVGDLGAGYQGSGSLTIINDANVYSTDGQIAFQNLSSGTVTVDGTGTTWSNSGNLYVGNNGSGLLQIQNGATVSNETGYISFANMGGPMDPLQDGIVIVEGAGSTWTNRGELFMGGSGTDMDSSTAGGASTLSISAGATVSNTIARIGWVYGGSAAVTVDGSGSAWTNTDLHLGIGDNGTITVTNGASVTSANAYLGSYSATGSVMVAGAESTWTNTGTAIYSTKGMITIADNGTVITNAIQTQVSGPFPGARTVVNFNGGTLKAHHADNAEWVNLGSRGSVTVGDGGATFDTNGYNMGIVTPVYTASMVTDGGVTKIGAGALTLSGTNAYTGVTTVKVGMLTLIGVDMGMPSAWDPVLTGGGADLQGGKLVFNYAGGTSPAGAIATIMDDSFGTGSEVPFAQGNGAQIYSTTADASGMALGWMDDGVDEVTVMYTLYGDSNLDSSVNGTDLNAVLSYYNQSSEIWNHGDFNYDGSVNGTDLNTVLSNYNQSLPSSTAAVPEPSTLLLMVLGLVGLLAWTKRK